MGKYILCADLHIRASRPQYRSDAYCDTIFGKILFIVNLANRYDADILIAGDLFENIRVGIGVVNRLIRIFKLMKGVIYTVPGQHDKEYHGVDMTNTPYLTLIESGVIQDLSSFGNIGQIYGVGWEGTLASNVKSKKGNILVIHHAVTEKEPPFFLKDSAFSAQEMMKRCPEFQYIVSGDYHVPFVAKNSKHQTLINCGCIGRSNRDQYNFKPMVHLLDTDKDSVTSIEIPIKDPEEVFNIPKDTKQMDVHFSEHIDEILKATENGSRPDFITTVRIIMTDELFTKTQKELAEKYYHEEKES